MKGSHQIEQIRQAIEILEGMEEKNTEPFRIVLITLKQKEKDLFIKQEHMPK